MRKKSNPWRKLATDSEQAFMQGPEGEFYPAIVDGEPGALTEEEMAAMYPRDREGQLINEELSREADQYFQDFGKFQPLPQQVKRAPGVIDNSWSALAAGSPEPTIFNQASNTIRRRMWR